MTRKQLATFAALSLSLGLTTGVAVAQQSECDKWIAKISDEAGNRFDDASNAAKVKVEEIAAMCKAGKTAEAEKAAKDTMTSLGIKP